MKRVTLEGPESPWALVRRTSTEVFGGPAGTVAVIWVGESITNEAEAPPNRTALTSENCDPWMVTLAPPAGRLALGESDVT